VGICLISVTLCGCGQPTDPTQTPLSPVPAQATLDYTKATIELPLDQFGMTSREISIVMGARDIAFARCLAGGQQVSPQEIQNAAGMLQTDFGIDEPNWIGGWWNAAYIAQNGWYPRSKIGMELGTTMHASDDKMAACQDDPAVNTLTPLAVDLSMNGDTAAANAFRYRTDANDRVTNSPVYSTLSSQMELCLKNAGYVLDTNPREEYPGIKAKLDQTWPQEQILKAVLASATCNDQLGVTQQYANLQAGYEQALINQHQAELTALRAEASQRVAKAEVVLESVGLH